MGTNRHRYVEAMEGMEKWSWETNPRTVRLAQALRVIRDTTDGYAANVARRSLDEAGIEDPDDA